MRKILTLSRSSNNSDVPDTSQNEVSFNRENKVPQQEVTPQDMAEIPERLVQSISFLAPAKRINVDIDVTHKAALPAILETGLLLVAQLDAISPEEIQSFFGISYRESEILFQELLKTELVKLDQQGDLVATSRLIAQQREQLEDDVVTLEQVSNFKEGMVVDMCTGYIQPRSEQEPRLGLPSLPVDEKIQNSIDYQKTLNSQFARFKFCLPNSKRDLKQSNTRLYRINRTSHDRTSILPLTLDIYACHDQLLGMRLEPRLVGFSEDAKALVTNSGLVGFTSQYLEIMDTDTLNIDLDQYCKLFNDHVLVRYKKDSYLDLKSLLMDRKRRKTGYGDERTRMIIGPIYLGNNRELLFQWLNRQSKENQLKQACWFTPSGKLFGASLGLTQFCNEANKALELYGSMLNLLFSAPEYDSVKKLKDRFKGRATNIRYFPEDLLLEPVEALIIPGEHGWAMVQYHTKVSPELGLCSLTIPIGFVTYDPERVNHIWNTLTRRIDLEAKDLLSKKLDVSELNKLLGFESDEELVD